MARVSSAHAFIPVPSPPTVYFGKYSTTESGGCASIDLDQKIANWLGGSSRCGNLAIGSRESVCGAKRLILNVRSMSAVGGRSGLVMLKLSSSESDPYV